MKRKATTVKDLAQWIAADLARNGSEITCFEIDRKWSLDPHLGLSPRTAEALVTLHERLGRAIPDDFDYFITFEESEISSTVEYQDGMMAGFGMGLPVRPDRNFIENLRDHDWDDVRNQAMTTTQSMESGDSGPVPDWFKEHLASKRNQR